ncbi:mechanosensitive ion channel family protein [Bacillus carboniphilus]|uniref:Mechanosensitive ion channel family protein n=1 Tax=Bacillus carboniphilus TaxID=86663 RepID=A0ABY9JUY3_9BACI|nr:mechanosensitive ion channel family protein [Bacillus carboniphilus]WLR42533.1 mechanosensitive ion channel family protein [Bacillus carboniphilus]
MEEVISLYHNPYIQTVVIGIILWISVVIINKLVHNFFKRTSLIDDKKEKTMESIIRSLTKYVATFSFIIVAIDVLFEINMGTVLAGAGVAGIVIGLGAQSLITDILAGIFHVYEKQLHKGDFITVNNSYSGTVEDIGLRSLKIRQWSGKLLTISNGQIKAIENYNIGHMRVIESVDISYREDPQKVKKLLDSICSELNDQFEECLKKDAGMMPIQPFQVYGITSLQSNYRGYEYTVIGLVEDQHYWPLSTETRNLIAQTMFDHNIKMAEDRLYFSDDKFE